MKRFYLAGHTNFGNRGNEALARSTLKLLTERFGEVELLVPSYAPSDDRRQWRDSERQGVRFVAVPEFPSTIRWWSRADRLAPMLAKNWFPRYVVPPRFAKDVESCDGIVASGGDVISVDYGVPSLLWNMGFLDHFAQRGMPTLVWAASLGPFVGSEVEQLAVKFFRKLPAITVRETITEAYLHRLGLGSITKLVADPAFVLDKEIVDLKELECASSSDFLIGLNVSPLIAKFRPRGEQSSVMIKEIAQFIRKAVSETGGTVVLIPHVGPLDGSTSDNDDHDYLRRVATEVADLQSRVRLLPKNLNASQLKFAISQCRFFIGARTHSTIAAFSNGVPTICIAYSVKAKGLNIDLFGDERYVIDTPKVTSESLWGGLQRLVTDEESLKALLKHKMIEWQARAKETAAVMERLTAGRSMLGPVAA